MGLIYKHPHLQFIDIYEGKCTKAFEQVFCVRSIGLRYAASVLHGFER